MEELKPCPFCGSDEPLMHNVEIEHNGKWLKRYEVYCNNCGARTLRVRQEESAILRWNRRADDEKSE